MYGRASCNDIAENGLLLTLTGGKNYVKYKAGKWTGIVYILFMCLNVCILWVRGAYYLDTVKNYNNNKLYIIRGVARVCAYIYVDT